jgi:ABC-type uncharacterized transport system permease subunit
MLRRSASHTRLLNGERSLTDCGEHGMLEALVDRREQVIQDGLHSVNSVKNATDSFTLLASSLDSKGFGNILLNNITVFTLLAAVSSTLTVTLQAALASFTVLAITSSTSTLTLQAAVTSFTVSAALTSFTMLAAAASFSLLASNSCNEGTLDTKIKSAEKTGGIKLKAKRFKQRREIIAGDRVHSV